MTEKLGELGATERVIPKSDPDRMDGPKPGGSEDHVQIAQDSSPQVQGRTGAVADVLETIPTSSP